MGKKSLKHPRAATTPTIRTEAKPRLSPRLWIGNVAELEQGILVGGWIALDQKPKKLAHAIRQLCGPDAELGDWVIFDSADCPFLTFENQHPIGYLSAVGRGIAGYGEAFGAWSSLQRDSTPDTKEFLRHSQGLWPSIYEYAVDYLAADRLERALAKHPGRLECRRRLRTMVCQAIDDMIRYEQLRFIYTPSGEVWVFHQREDSPF